MGDEEYRTGPSYDALDEEGASDGGAARREIHGEGLDALDPEVGSQTKSLEAHPREGDPDDDGFDDGLDDGLDGGGEAEAGAEGDANATRAGPPIKLEVFGGPDAGRTRRFKAARLVIGRAPGVDLRLRDQSVSRRHVELVQADGQVLLRDLGSGNGTKVNGVSVAEKRLEHGDEIQLGKTKVRFVDEVAAFNRAREAAEKKEAEAKAAAEAKAKAEAEAEAKAASAASAVGPEGVPAGVPVGGDADGEEGPPTRSSPQLARGSVRAGRREPLLGAWQRLNPRLRLLVAGVATLAAAIVAAGILLRPAPPKVDPGVASAEQKMQDARSAVRAGDYESAVRLVEEAEKLVPGIDRSKLGNQAREELAVSRALEEARGDIGARKFDEARRLLDAAPTGSNKIEAVKVEVRRELAQAELAYKKEKLDDLLGSGDLEGAKGVLGELPVDQQEESARKIAEFERQVEAQKKEGALALARAQAGASARRKAEREEELLAAFTTVERKFASAEWDRAASECERVVDQAGGDKEVRERARMLQSAMPSFGRLYDEGLKKYRQGALAQAARPLRQALELYERMQLKRNKFEAELQSKLGDASLVAGRDALIRDDLVGAYRSFHDALRFDPGSGKAKEGLAAVEAKAQELFQTAYAERDHDPPSALKKMRIVVDATDPSSLLHEKAKNHVAALAP